MQKDAGFTLLEMVAAIVLIGFIAIFSAIFVSTGMRGALSSRQSEENALKAQIALDRIALELRDISGGPGTGGAPIVTGTSIRYTSSATGLSGSTRRLSYSGSTITLAPVDGGTAYTLVDGVRTCAMSFSGATTGATITVTFTLTNTNGSFSITVKPRNAIPTPVTS